MTWAGPFALLQSAVSSAAAFSAGYVTNDTLGADGFGVNGAGRFFASDNFAIGGNLGYHSLDVLGVDVDVLNYCANAEFQITGVPISLTASYNRSSIDEADTDVDTLKVGARYTWGGSLKERDRTGPSQGLSTGASLTNVF